MIALAVLMVLSATPIGACSDRSACRFRVGDDAALGEAVRALGLTTGELKAPGLKSLEGDLAFELSFRMREADVVVKAKALQRVGIWGEGSDKVIAVPNPAWRPRALQSALKTALVRALEDLKVRITGVRQLLLSVQLSSLDDKARTHAEQSLLPCLKSLYSLSGPVSTPERRAGFLDEAIEYLPEKNEPRDPLAFQVERVREALLGGGRSKCSVGGTALQGWSTSVAADTLNGAVVVSFKR